MIRVGNVIRPPGSDGLWIVCEVGSKNISAVAFDWSNCSATQPILDTAREQSCYCGTPGEENWDNNHDCEFCNGTGYGTYVQHGWGNSEIVAPNVKEFIMQGVKKLFNF